MGGHMIKHILVATDGSDQARLGVEYAVALAKRSSAVLHGLYVVDVKMLEGPYLRDITASLGQEPYMNHQGALTRILEERGESALEDVQALAEEAGVTCKTETTTGIVATTIVNKGELCDLVVIGRAGEHSDWLENVLGSTTESVARRSHQPVIVTGHAEPGFGNLLCAYDGSENARAALHIAADLAREWDAKLTVFTAGQSKAEKVQQEAKDFLHPHELNVDYVVDDKDAEDAIIDYAKDNPIDLIIIGAYGHSVVREMLLGSTTTHILNHTPCPVLLAR